jgi:hypothetical protein
VFGVGGYCIPIESQIYKAKFYDGFISTIVNFFKNIKNYVYNIEQSTTNIKPVVRKYSDIKLTETSFPNIGTR